MVVATRANASLMTNNVKVVAGITSKTTPVFSGNHGDDWTIWEMNFSAHLMEKGLDTCLDPDFENRLPTVFNKKKNEKDQMSISMTLFFIP